MPQETSVKVELNSRLTALTSGLFLWPLGSLVPRPVGSPVQLAIQRLMEDLWLHDPSPFPLSSGEKGNGVMSWEVLDSDLSSSVLLGKTWPFSEHEFPDL